MKHKEARCLTLVYYIFISQAGRLGQDVLINVGKGQNVHVHECTYSVHLYKIITKQLIEYYKSEQIWFFGGSEI